MVKWWLACFVAFSLYATEDNAFARVQCHMLIGDVNAAIVECRSSLKIYPQSKGLQRLLVQALAKRGFEKDALAAWHVVADKLEGEEKRSCLEALAWGVLSRARDSNQFVIQYSSLMGARRVRDSVATKVVQQCMHSTNHLMRALAIKIASEFRDAVLIDEIKRLFVVEKNFYVRLEVMQAIGRLGLHEMSDALKDVIASERTMAEEKACAIQALVNLYDACDEKELDKFIHAKRAGLRAIAPQIVAHLDLYDQLPKLLPLLSDASSLVRMLTLSVFGQMHQNIGAHKEAVLKLMHDPDANVAITACWVGLLMAPELGEVGLAPFAEHKNEDVRHLAVSALIASGDRGTSLAMHLMKKSKDPIVRANSAFALILKEHDVKKACRTLNRFLDQFDGKLMWDQHSHPIFRALVPSQVRHHPSMPGYPTQIDELTRLELLSILAMQDDAKAKKRILRFVKSGTWGVAHAACATLLGEGNQDALDMVRGLLDDKDVKVRVQAALVLAFLASDPSACHVLMDAYTTVDRDVKLTLLEALGSIGSEDVFPFLVKRLDEPFQVLRATAASSIIQCLYH